MLDVARSVLSDVALVRLMVLPDGLVGSPSQDGVEATKERKQKDDTVSSVTSMRSFSKHKTASALFVRSHQWAKG